MCEKCIDPRRGHLMPNSAFKRTGCARRSTMR
uniref:Uncharacterized protein n=2 Tax=Pseudomonadota TaxID=1224 RepID=B2M0J5_ECOLX|nr:unknown [Escherichia coli]APQ44888.1 hypothetical protein [Escherichia coli]QJU69828.1 ORF5 [Escherichia coli]QJU69831.1 ORF5 [Escherichia coli]